MAVTYTATAVTKNVQRKRSTANSTTTSNGTYVDATNQPSLTSVPQGYIIGGSFSGQKSTGGTGAVRVTDGTNTFAEKTAISTSVELFILLGTQDQAAVAVKVQIKSTADTNTFTLVAGGTTNHSMLACGRFAVIPTAVNVDYTFDFLGSCTSLDFTATSTTDNANTQYCAGSAIIQSGSDVVKTVTFGCIVSKIHYGCISATANAVIFFDITGALITAA